MKYRVNVEAYDLGGYFWRWCGHVWDFYVERGVRRRWRRWSYLCTSGCGGGHIPGLRLRFGSNRLRRSRLHCTLLVLLDASYERCLRARSAWIELKSLSEMLTSGRGGGQKKFGKLTLADPCCALAPLAQQAFCPHKTWRAGRSRRSCALRVCWRWYAAVRALQSETWWAVMKNVQARCAFQTLAPLTLS